MDKIRANRKKLIMILLVCTVIMWLLNIGLGAVSISLSQMWEVLVIGSRVTNQTDTSVCADSPARAGCSSLRYGTRLSSGAVIQTVLGNTLAGPNIIGVNAGAGFVVVLCGSLLPGMYGMVPLAAFFGAFITVIMVYLLSRYTGSSKITLVLSGIAINSLLSAATDVIYTFDADSLVRSNGFRIGRLSGINISVLIPAGVAIVAAVVVTAALHNEMEVLSLGDENGKDSGAANDLLPFRFSGTGGSSCRSIGKFCGASWICRVDGTSYCQNTGGR